MPLAFVTPPPKKGGIARFATFDPVLTVTLYGITTRKTGSLGDLPSCLWYQGGPHPGFGKFSPVAGTGMPTTEGQDQ